MYKYKERERERAGAPAEGAVKVMKHDKSA